MWAPLRSPIRVLIQVEGSSCRCLESPPAPQRQMRLASEGATKQTRPPRKSLQGSRDKSMDDRCCESVENLKTEPRRN